jgi:hypothetical protein
MVGLSIMGAASPSIMNMSLAPFEAQKRAQNLGVAETSAVTFSAANEGATQLTGNTPQGCEIFEISSRAYEVTCIEGEGTKYVQTVTRAFRLKTEDLSCDDNDGNNGHGNSGGHDCSNPGNSGYANNVRVFDFPSPPGFTGHQCLATDNWGLDTSAFDRSKNKWKGKSCTPGDIWHNTFYENSDPNAWMYDVNGHNGWGDHKDY